MSKIEYKGLTADVWYDDRDPSNKGWYAEYRDTSGRTYSDSMKVWEGEEMPRRKSAEKKAHALALRALKAEYRRRRDKAILRPHHATKKAAGRSKTIKISTSRPIGWTITDPARPGWSETGTTSPAQLQREIDENIAAARRRGGLGSFYGRPTPRRKFR